MVPPYSDRIPRVPPYSSSSQCVHFCVRGCHPVSRAFPDASTNTHTDSGSGLLPVRSPLLGESRLISFPRGTYLSLTVLVHSRSVRSIAPWRMVPPYSDRIPRVPPYSSSSQCVHFCVRGCHPVSRAFPDASSTTHSDSGSGLLPVRSPLLGESRLISFPRGT